MEPFIQKYEEEFDPSDAQVDVRRSVRMLYNEGFCMVTQWISEIPSFTMKKWEAWQGEAGFWDWWLEMIPEHSGITTADVKMLEFETLRALVKGLRDDNMGAVKAAMSLTQNANQTDGVNDDGLDDWWDAGSDKAWIPTKEEK
tara:strand:- start:1182 stop:1610 length:429 start_codon:yes stop_codon:yes gene_type:complete